MPTGLSGQVSHGHGTALPYAAREYARVAFTLRRLALGPEPFAPPAPGPAKPARSTVAAARGTWTARS